MEKFRIFGGCRLAGTIAVSGAKNAALPCLAASLLTRDEVKLTGLPRVRDILTMEKVLATLGEQCIHENGTTTVVMGQATATHAPYELVRTMRASVLVLGPLVAARRQARVALPGGCAIGARPIDLHLSALTQLGADIRLERGDVVAEAPRGLKGAKIRFPRITVTGTENVLMAATLAKGRSVLLGCAREPEVVDLAAMLSRMGAKIFGAGTDTIEVEGVEELSGCTHRIIPDRIEAGTYLMAALMVGNGVRIEACRPEHLATVLEILRDAGAKVGVEPEALVVPKQEKPLSGFAVETEEYPGFPTDLQAQAMALATQANGVSEIVEAIFENRFQHVLELKRLGANITVEGRRARIFGPSRLQGTTVMASDLRASAALVLAGLVAEGETVVDRIYHLDRGYEAMEAKLARLGARIERFNPGPFQ
ncbi:MAG: UDP-N-acetylglucosamine 1-carboxyvinyltransferase [Thermoanaerobaculum sp.]